MQQSYARIRITAYDCTTSLGQSKSAGSRCATAEFFDWPLIRRRTYLCTPRHKLSWALNEPTGYLFANRASTQAVAQDVQWHDGAHEQWACHLITEKLIRLPCMTNQKRSLPTRRVTMRDVAKLAQVSQSTVSRVLSRTPQAIPIGEETRQRVLTAVEQLGYYPNLHAGSLRGQPTRLIAMMIADIANSFYHPMVRAVQDIAHHHGYDVLVANSDHLRANELHFCESLIRRPVDGIIMVPYHLTDEDLDRLLVQTNAAIAVLGRHITHPAVDVVGVDDSAAMFTLTEWLIHTRQHHRIAYIGVTNHFAVGARRHAAFMRAMAQAGLPVNPDYQQEGDWSVESGYQVMQSLLALPQPPTAVVVCNDQMAIGAMLAAERQGLRVPADVAVTGFDDIPAASWIRPRLTTVAQPAAAIGQALAHSVFQRITGVVTEQHQFHQIQCQLMIRESA